MRREMLTTDPGEGQEVDVDQIITKQGIVYPYPKISSSDIMYTKFTSSI